MKGVVNGASSAEVSSDSRVLTGWATEAIWRQFPGPGAIPYGMALPGAKQGRGCRL
jgi:hypothetical protein